MSTCQPGPRCQPDVNFVGSVSLSACFGCVGSRAAVCVDMGLDVSPMSTWAVMSAHVSFVDVVSLSVGCMSTLGFNRVNNWRRNRNCVRLYVGRLHRRLVSLGHDVSPMSTVCAVAAEFACGPWGLRSSAHSLASSLPASLQRVCI